ncbi:molecular chaperone GrpE [Ardenticatena maritima]|uniref:Protein GrpE n=1 Tax=Ardenticatena maritima TaxID=872965 RepID=A0A0M9UBM6_9CHLR|nr:nucleotide exchange factor GrpE [Ardenticatena maritima]GAP62010.1 molecular chaperone GrpE [Ardenticatena maritima]
MFPGDPFNRRTVRKIPVRPRNKRDDKQDEPTDDVAAPPASDDPPTPSTSRDTVLDNITKAFQQELAQAYKERDEWQQRYAELEKETRHMRERLRRIAEEEAFREQIRTLEKMLDIADNIERALAAADEPSALAEGVRLTYRELMRALQDLGVERIEALGQPFDPAFHHAVGVVATDEHAPGTVVAVERPGYRYRGRVLRPAFVHVAAEPTT